jgi:hypothetical protein
MNDLARDTRLTKINEHEYAYRPMYNRVRKVSAEYVEATYQKHFPGEELNEDHMLLALDLEQAESTSQ